MGQCRHVQYILYITVIDLLLLFESVSCTNACREPVVFPLNSHGSRDITEMSRYILPSGNNIIPGQGTLYRVEPQLINITHHIEFKLGSKEDYTIRNFPFGREFISTGADCPWLFLKNIDDNRIPHVLYEAKCVLHKCIGNTLCNCKEVYSYINVVRRTRCVNGVYEYSTIAEPVAVGCTCVRRPRAIRRPTMHH